MCMPERASCKPWLMVPEGTYAVITKNGRFIGIWEPGIHFCLAWTKIQYLITQQSVVFDLPIRNCPTVDNIFITIDVSIVLHIREGEENLKNFVYNTSINQLNELLDSAISERIRVLARTKTHLEAYAIKGKEHT